MNEWIENLIQDGYDLSKYNMDQMEEMYTRALEEEASQSTLTIEEAVMGYLQHHGFANNPVSAEVVYNNMSEGWRDDVVNQINEMMDKEDEDEDSDRNYLKKMKQLKAKKMGKG